MTGAGVFVVLRYDGIADYFVAAAAGLDCNFAFEDKATRAVGTYLNIFDQGLRVQAKAGLAVLYELSRCPGNPEVGKVVGK